ncbi:hypothetical protein BDN71DRAFT_1450058 [Pleurotus eryngii]|uniref:Uncharacterized protein n=1 Tax=Pleurotus eryngii TaxID=5323 RepID=A0A9P5ZSE7_PLEER|nr:hypothetical protein BDN71DRAFT_1450058 [Pleurotus eryngii]
MSLVEAVWPKIVPRQPGTVPTYKFSNINLFGMDITVFVAFVLRRPILFAAKEKTPDSAFPFDKDSEEENEGLKTARLTSNENENIALPGQSLLLRLAYTSSCFLQTSLDTSLPCILLSPRPSCSFDQSKVPLIAECDP